MRARAFNPQIFLETLCYCVFGGILLYLVSSGKYLSYVTPRMKPYLYFTIIVMGIWTLTGLARVFRPQHKLRASHCFVLAIPILLLLLPHSPLSAADFSGNYIGGNMFPGQTGQYGAPQKPTPPSNSSFSIVARTPTEDASEDNTQSVAPAESSSTDADSNSALGDSASTDSIATPVPDTQSDTQDETFSIDAPYEEYSTKLPGLDDAKKKITVSNDDFGMWFFEICVNMEKYEGYTIVMTGAVFKDPRYMEEDEFVPSRMMMSCCAADLATAG